MAKDVLVRRPVFAFFLYFVMFTAIRLAFKWDEFKTHGRSIILGALVYSAVFSLMMVVLVPRLTKVKD